MIRLIGICGIDGSGKTTQVELLEKYLEKKGFRVKRVWFRWNAFLSYPFLALCRLLGYTKWKTVSRSKLKYAERRFYMNKALAILWPWLSVTDALINSILKVKLWERCGYTILCDRYILDILVDLICETKDYELPKRLVSKLFLSLVPKNSKLIIIDVDERTAYARKNDIPHISYLRERRKLYLNLAEMFGIPVINGERERKEVYQDILEILKRSKLLI